MNASSSSPPARGARAEILLRELRSGCQQLVVEVAPAELPHERLRVPVVERPRDHLPGRDAAEVEIRREPRSRVGAEIVGELRVACKPAVEPRVETPAAGSLAPGRQLRGGSASYQLVGLGQRPGLEPIRERDPRRRREDVSPRFLAPAPPVGREDAEVVVARGREVAGRDDRDAGEHLELDPRAPERRPQPPFALLGVRAHVCGDVNCLGTHVLGGSDRLRHDIAAADDELRAALAQPCVQIPERADQEGDAVRRPERCEHGVVQNEERHDLLRAFDRSAERRVVVDAKIAREQNDVRLHGQRVDRNL